MIIKLKMSLKSIISLVCDACIVIKSVFAEVVAGIKVSIKESVATKLLTGSNQEETIITRNTITEGDHHG